LFVIRLERNGNTISIFISYLRQKYYYPSDVERFEFDNIHHVQDVLMKHILPYFKPLFQK